MWKCVKYACLDASIQSLACSTATPSAFRVSSRHLPFLHTAPSKWLFLNGKIINLTDGQMPYNCANGAESRNGALAVAMAQEKKEPGPYNQHQQSPPTSLGNGSNSSNGGPLGNDLSDGILAP